MINNNTSTLYNKNIEHLQSESVIPLKSRRPHTIVYPSFSLFDWRY